MGGLGFGSGATPRAPFSSLSEPSVLIPVVSPSAGYNGTPGSGFGGSYGALPVDPVRTTAKPAMRLLVPDRQWFTDELLIGVIAMANNNGTLLDNLGLEKVICHFEGKAVEISAPSFATFNDANGVPVTYLGWWCRLEHGGTNGHGRVYFEAVPQDATMQRRVTGPHQFSPRPAVHDLELQVAASQPTVAGQRYPTLNAAIAFAKAQNRENPRITIIEAGRYDLTDGSPTKWTIPGYCTIEAAVPATIGRPGPFTSDAAFVLIPPRIPLHFKGSNITLDFQFMSEIRGGGFDGCHWLDGVTVTNTHPEGREMVRRGRIPNTFGSLVRDAPWMTECAISEVHVPCLGVTLARGCTLERVAQDIMSNAKCVVGNLVRDHSSEFLNASLPAFTVRYLGAETTATLARSGGTEGNDGLGPGTSACRYTAKWGGNTATFEVGQAEGYWLGTLGNGYWFADVVAWLNTLPGWSATLQDNKFYAVTGSLAGRKGQGFADTDCKSSTLQVVSHTDKHGDFYQHTSSYLENVIVMNNCAHDIWTQFMFLSPIGGADESDIFFINNAWWMTEVPDYTSQFGRSGVLQSHVVIAHNSLSNQGISLRRDNSGYELDKYCLFANNTAETFGWSGGNVDTDATVKNNHLQDGANVPPSSTGTTVGGTRASLFADATIGNFTPAGALLANRKVPVVRFDQNHRERLATAPAGALA